MNRKRCVLHTSADWLFAGVFIGVVSATMVMAGDEQQREVKDAKSHREAVDSGVRRTVSDAEARDTVSEAEPSKSVSDAEPRESVSDAEVRHAETEAKASSKLPDGKIHGEVVKSDDEGDTSGAREDEQGELQDRE